MTIHHDATPRFADNPAGLATKARYQSSPKTLDQASQSAARLAEAASLKRNLIIAAHLSIPVVVFAMGPHLVPSFHDILMRRIGHQANLTIQLVLTTLVLVWPDRQFFTNGVPALLRFAPDMNSLVSIGAFAS